MRYLEKDSNSSAIDEWVKNGKSIKKETTRKAKGYQTRTKFKANSHMNTKKPTHVYWLESESTNEVITGS